MIWLCNDNTLEIIKAAIMKRKTACLRNVITTFLLLLSSVVFSQNNFTVNGKVTDEANKPLTGVTVQVKGTTTITTTAADGSFQITVPSQTSALVLSYVGYEQQEISVGNRREISLSLKSAANSMENVVVIGYGTQKRKNVTGAVSSFDARKINEQPVRRLDEALVEQLVGVIVGQTTGMQGKG